MIIGDSLGKPEGMANKTELKLRSLMDQGQRGDNNKWQEITQCSGKGIQ